MSENFKPKVSIVIPVYNGADYLREAIDAALSQTYDNLEIIVVNDGSKDHGKTEKVALSYGNQIHYYYKENGGVSTALNYGISKMTGEYFSWLSHDDKYSETKIKDSVELLERFNDTDRANLIAFTGGIYIDSESKEIKPFPVLFQELRVYHGLDVIQKMLKGNTLNGCCMLIPKTAFEKCGGFDELLRYNQDALMWDVIFTSGYNLVSDNKPNVMYRLHRNQTSKLRRDLYLHDTVQASETLIPLFAEKTTKDCKLLFLYARRVAIGYCAKAVSMCIDYGRNYKIFSIKDIAIIKVMLLLGGLRNFIKIIRNKLLK